MSMVINHNLSALNTFNQLNKNSSLMNSSLEKLSSGYSINSAADDAAGLSISEKMRAQIRGLDQASDNSQDAISLVQTAEGGLEETDSILQRMRELAVQASNDTNTSSERENIQDEIDALTSAIDTIANNTEFNTKKLLNGSAAIAATVTGATAAYTVTGGSADTAAGVTFTLDAATAATSASATTTVTYASTSALLTAASSVTLNGVAFSFTTGNSVQNVLDAVNNAGIGVKATYDSSTGAITFATSAVGSAAKITTNVAGTGNLSIFSAGTVSGTDASVTILAASAAVAGSYTADGNTITITSGTAKGLTFNVNSSTTTDTSITVDSNGTMTFQIGANEGQTMSLGISDMRADALGVGNIDVSTTTAASAAITTIETAIEKVSAQRSKLGAVQNRLESTINSLTTTSENLSAAESNIRDVDMASEMATYTKLSVITQAATAMLAQANQQPQQVLTLLK